jgi:TetR/AcrR family transcriptional regulator
MASIRKSGKLTAGRRPKVRRDEPDTRAMILAAARKIFAVKGIDGTSVREVADAAKVNNAMIYYYFKDKEDLHRAVLADSLSAMSAIWDDRIFKQAVTVKQKIQRYVEKYIRFQQVNEDLRRILAMEFAASGGDVTWMCEQYFADNYARLSQIFKEGMKSGELKKFNPSLAVSSLIGIIIHNFILQPMAEHVHGKNVDLSPKKFGAFVTELFFNGLGSNPMSKAA